MLAAAVSAAAAVAAARSVLGVAGESVPAATTGICIVWESHRLESSCAPLVAVGFAASIPDAAATARSVLGVAGESGGADADGTMGGSAIAAALAAGSGDAVIASAASGPAAFAPTAACPYENAAAAVGCWLSSDSLWKLASAAAADPGEQISCGA